MWATWDGDSGQLRAAPAAAVVDTTGAGDAFVAALAVSLAEGTTLLAAVAHGNVVGAHVVAQRGAGPPMPSRAEIAQRVSRLLHHQ